MSSCEEKCIIVKEDPRIEGVDLTFCLHSPLANKLNNLSAQQIKSSSTWKNHLHFWMCFCLT